MKTNLLHKNFPKSWQHKTVDDICFIGRGRVINKEELQANPGSYPVYSSQTSNKGIFGCISSFDFEGEYLTWTTDGEYAGTVFYRNGKFNCTNVCGTLKAKEEIDMKFLAYCLSESTYKHVVRTANPKLMNGVMAKIELAIPTGQEQKKIAEILSAVDEEIQKTDEMISQTEKLKISLTSELFTKGIGHKKFKKTILGLLPENWSTCFIFEVAQDLDNKRVPITKSEREKGEYPYYGATGIIDYVGSYIYDSNLLLISEDGANLKDRNYPIAFSVSGKTWVNNHAHVLLFENYSVQKFVEYYLNSIDLSPYLTGSAQPKLNKDKMSKILLPKPGVSELEEIVNIIKVVTKKIVTTKKLKEKLIQLKRGLMSDLLSGKVRVIK